MKPLVRDRLVKDVAARKGSHRFDRGLYLVVARAHAPGSASWVYRYFADEKARTMGLGSLRAVSLTNALRLADEAREARGLGSDPISDRHTRRRDERKAKAEEVARAVTFRQVAAEYVDTKRIEWSTRHGELWVSSLEQWVHPIIGDMVVGQIDTAAVLKVLRQAVVDKGQGPRSFWIARAETARRVRGRIEAILDYAKAHDRRSGDNPAAMEGKLRFALPSHAKIQVRKQHPALPHAEVSDFMAALRACDGTAAKALEFKILTAARSDDVEGMTWGEIDLDGKLWTVTAERMKNTKAAAQVKGEHRVPLSDRAVELLGSVKPETIDPRSPVFAGRKKDQGLSKRAMNEVIERMNKGEGGPRWIDPDPKQDGAPVVPHGFRSTFRDWVDEKTTYSRHAAEMALDHAIKNKTEAFYRRNDMLDVRRGMMQDWADYCAGKRPAE